MAESRCEYDVALSFAGEDRKYIEGVAAALQRADIRVFYDEYEKVTLWGKDLYTHLHSVYQDKARYTIMFVSEHYARNLWTNHERKAAQARALREIDTEYLLPARFDDTEIPGLPNTIGYVDLRSISPSDLAEMIVKKLSPETGSGQKQQVPDREQISALIKKLQSPDMPVAACLADGLIVAEAAGDNGFVEFCEKELVGYNDLLENALEKYPHRFITMWCSLSMVNTQFLGWGENPSTMFTYMKSHSDEFTEKQIFLTQPIASIEKDAQGYAPNRFLCIEQKLGKFDPTTAHPEATVHCYAPGKSYPEVVQRVRNELTKRLVDIRKN